MRASCLEGSASYDDGGLAAPPDGGPYGPSRGLILNLDVQNHTASLARPPYYHDPALFANSQGNLQVLGNGDVLVGWGSDGPPGGVLSSYLHRVFQQWVGSRRLLPGRPRRFLPRLQPSVGRASAHEAGCGGRRCERANDRIRLMERLDRDGRLGVARRPHAGVAVACVDHTALGL